MFSHHIVLVFQPAPWHGLPLGQHALMLYALIAAQEELDLILIEAV